MKDFLSNIGFGVVDLDDFLKEGPSALMPTFLFNPTKQAESKIKKIQREQGKIFKLYDEVNDKQKAVLEEIYDNLDGKLKEQKKEKTRSEIEKGLRSSTLGGQFQNMYQSGSGKVIIGAVGAMANSVQKTFSKVTSTVDETGMSASKLLEDFDAIGQSSRDILLNGERLYNSVDRNFETFIKLRREFGATENLSVKLLDNVSQMENIIGITNEDAVSLLSTFRGINRETAETNYKLIRGASQLADANNVAFRDVMEDITENSEFFATYMSQSSDKISEIIVKSRRLGISFGTFNKIFENLSGIESTIENQAKMSIFSGQRMNFLDVLEKNYFGDVEGSMKSIMDQLGGISQSQFDNPFVKKQLAGGFGIGVEELNKLYREATGTMTVEDKLERSLNDFNENFKQLGFGTLKKDFIQYVVNPLSNLFKNNTQQIQKVFDGIGTVIKGIGNFTTFIAKGYAKLMKILPEWAGATVTIGAGIGALATSYVTANAINLKQLAHLASIDMKMTGAMGGGGGIMNTLYGKKYKGGQFMKGGGVAKAGGQRAGGLLATKGAKIGGGVLSVLGGGIMGYGDKTKDGVDPASFWGTVGAGALAGGAYGIGGGLAGIGVGAGIGALTSGVGYFIGDAINDSESRRVKANRGGIFKKRYTGQMDVAEAGKPEGFVPLETQDGKPTMPVNLSDDAIKKLASAISKIKFTGNVTVDGKKNKTMEFYNQVMQPSSPLNV